VDDLKSSHIDSKVNDKFLVWLTKLYGKVSPVKATRGPQHDYLAIFLEHKNNGTVVADMAYYIKKMVEEFPDKLRNGVMCPWTE